MYTRTADRDAALMGLVLIAMVSACALLAGLGVINYMNGNLLRASASLAGPAFLAYWAWQVRDNLGSEPLIPVFSVAWLAGLPIGVISYSVHQLWG